MDRPAHIINDNIPYSKDADLDVNHTERVSSPRRVDCCVAKHLYAVACRMWRVKLPKVAFSDGLQPLSCDALRRSLWILYPWYCWVVFCEWPCCSFLSIYRSMNVADLFQFFLRWQMLVWTSARRCLLIQHFHSHENVTKFISYLLHTGSDLESIFIFVSHLIFNINIVLMINMQDGAF